MWSFKFRGLKGSGISAKGPANKQLEMIVRNPLTGRKDVGDERTVGGVSRSSVKVDSSAAHSTSSWSDGDIVELVHDTLPANVAGTSCAFGHVLGADRSEAEARGVRVRQLLTAAQVPAVLMRTCLFPACAYFWSLSSVAFPSSWRRLAGAMLSYHVD